MDSVKGIGVALISRFRGAIALVISLASPFAASAQAADQSHATEGKPPWELPWGKEDRVFADQNGLCVFANPFDRYDPEGFKKNGVNCWFPVVEKKSTYHIKIFDFSRTMGGLLFSNEGWASRPPVDVWVQGMHSADPTVSYRKSLSLYRLTCLDGVARFARLKFLAYDAGGKIVADWEKSSAPMKVAVPSSKEEAFAFFVCKG